MEANNNMEAENQSVHQNLSPVQSPEDDQMFTGLINLLTFLSENSLTE
jgi:hypothetical protein